MLTVDYEDTSDESFMHFLSLLSLVSVLTFYCEKNCHSLRFSDKVLSLLSAKGPIKPQNCESVLFLHRNGGISQISFKFRYIPHISFKLYMLITDDSIRPKGSFLSKILARSCLRAYKLYFQNRSLRRNASFMQLVA